MPSAIKILLAEDQALVLDALAKLLDMEADIEVLATLSNGKEVLEYLNASAEDIDLLVTDIEMPHMDGLSLAKQVQQDFPAIKILIMTTYNRSGYVKKALENAVGGFILKEQPVEVLAEAIRQVHSGRKYFDPELIASGLSDNNPLSPREIQVLQLVDGGMDNAAIAKKLCLSNGTIRNYLSEILSKLNAHNRVKAAAIAREKGWL